MVNGGVLEHHKISGTLRRQRDGGAFATKGYLASYQRPSVEVGESATYRGPRIAAEAARLSVPSFSSASSQNQDNIGHFDCLVCLLSFLQYTQ